MPVSRLPASAEDGEFKIQFNHWIIGAVRFLIFFYHIDVSGVKQYYVDPNLKSQIERIHNDGEEKSLKLLVFLFDEYLTLDACLHFSRLHKNI